MIKHAAAVAALTGALTLSLPGRAVAASAPWAPHGPETEVNTFKFGEQRDPALAADAAGNVIAAWHSQDQDGDGYGVYARRYAASGRALGPAFRVNQTTAGQQGGPEDQPRRPYRPWRYRAAAHDIFDRAGCNEARDVSRRKRFRSVACRDAGALSATCSRLTRPAFTACSSRRRTTTPGAR